MKIIQFKKKLFLKFQVYFYLKDHLVFFWKLLYLLQNFYKKNQTKNDYNWINWKKNTYSLLLWLRFFANDSFSFSKSKRVFVFIRLNERKKLRLPFSLKFASEFSPHFNFNPIKACKKKMLERKKVKSSEENSFS